MCLWGSRGIWCDCLDHLIVTMDQFFRGNRIYAVVGASSNPQKYGYKVLKWYLDRDLPVVPVNINSEKILGAQSVPRIQDVRIPEGSDLAVSVITPPAISKELVQRLREAQGPVTAIWFQPGSHTPDVIDLAKRGVPNVITDCILVNGDTFLPSHRL